MPGTPAAEDGADPSPGQTPGEDSSALPPADPIVLQIGDTVRHKNYGTGEILFFEPKRVMVDFVGIGIRRVQQTTLSKV